MKYPLILKYTYSFIISGNYYKEEVREYYELFSNEKNSKMVSINSVTDIKVNVNKLKENEVTFEYIYSKYSKPNTFLKDRDIIQNSYTLKRGEKVAIKCIETYWSYIKGGENGAATLEVEWISYDKMLEEIMEQAKVDKYNAIKVASILIKEKMYEIAFNMLIGTDKPSYELGLCYEKGYGTEIDLDKALDIYLEVKGFNTTKGIERIFRARGKRIKFDEVKETMIYESKGNIKKAYYSSIIPIEKSDNTLKNMRRNVELCVICFLEKGRPFNDPFQRPTDTMSRLATYYDVINKIAKEDRPVYHTKKYEDDPYDGGYFIYDVYHDDIIIETLQKEAKKDDVIALGALLVQFGLNIRLGDFSSYLLNNLEEIISRLIKISKSNKDKESGMAYYFLGLYYERFAYKAKDNYETYHYYTNNKTYTYIGKNIEKELDEYLKDKNIETIDLAKIIQELDKLYKSLKNSGNKEELKKIENYIIYVYNKQVDIYSKIEKENNEIAIKYFELALQKGFHIAISHLVNKIIKENPKEVALNILLEHEPYIPYVRDGSTEKYYKILKELKENINE